MGLDPNLILYACVAKETTVLAEFNSKDHPDLGFLALKCLAKTPSLHSNFSHTIRGKTYTFLIHEPLTYFAICDEKLENPDGLAFLESIKEAFGDVGNTSWSERKLHSLASHCFQGEFNPVFHRLLSVSNEVQGPHSRRMGMQVPERNRSMDSVRGTPKFGNVPLLEDHGGMNSKKKKKKKKKMRFFGDLFWIGKDKDGGERKVDVCDDDDSSLDFSASMHKSNRSISINQSGLSSSLDPVMFQLRAKKSWHKHVWIVLSLDLIICLILFSIWLWVCRGFKCIDG